MHRSRHPIDISLVVDDDDNDEDISNHHFIPSTTGDYSSLIVDSPSDTMCHRHIYSTQSPSPTSSNIQGSQPSQPPSTSSLRSTHRRLSHSSSFLDSNGSGNNPHRDRLRFNTWPRHRKEKRDILVEYDKRLGKSIIQELGIGINKTYRNPWGNLSYAQLITRAIDSSPWKRLTLNEVYEWIIRFVPYFKDKIDAKTSWGWKNSIRHNLSLHNQFIRVPIISSLSKGPVKYVWTINPSFKNNSPYKKYSLKRKRAAAAAAAAAAGVSNVNSSSQLSQNQEQTLESNSSQSLDNTSNNYHRHPTTSVAKATRLNEHIPHGNGSSSSTLNQLSVAAAMMSAGVTDPAAYRAFLNSQAAAMINKHKQQTVPPPSSTTTHSHRTNSSSFAHEPGLPVPKKVALGTDRYKQQQQQQHAEWLLSSYRQQSQSYNGNRQHQSSVPNKMMMNQQRSAYLPPPPPSSNTRINADINNLQRRVSSPPTYSSAAAAAAVQNKLLAQTKFWQAAVQAAAQAHQQQQQQQFHHQPQASNNPINELQNYINHSNTANGNHNKMSSYHNPETLKLLSTNNSLDEQHHYRNDPRYKLMRASYPNATNGSIPPVCLMRQRMNQNDSSTINSQQQQQIDMVTAAYHNYRRRSSGFSSTTSHGGPSDDESDEYVPPRKDSSTSNASSGYESGLATSRQSPPISSSIRTGSGSSITSEASTSSCYYNTNNGANLLAQRLTKINSNDIEMNDRQQLSLNAVGGYVDDLMERIRKMPPKKRSKFYQMLDEERLKDVNNHSKSKQDECDDDENEHLSSMNVPLPLTVAEVNSDEDEDRTLIEISSNSQAINDDEDNEERITDRLKQQFIGLNDKTYEELRSMGVPLSVLKAIALQHQQQTPSQHNNNIQLSNFLTNKCTVSSTNSSSDNKRLLNARTILRRILQQQQQQQQNSTNDNKSLSEPMDYTTDEDCDIIEDDDDEHQSSSTTTISHHRNIIRSNSHNSVTVMLNPNDISSLSPPTSTSSSPDETDVKHQSNSNSISRPSSTPATLVSSACSF